MAATEGAENKFRILFHGLGHGIEPPQGHVGHPLRCPARIAYLHILYHHILHLRARDARDGRRYRIVEESHRRSPKVIILIRPSERYLHLHLADVNVAQVAGFLARPMPEADEERIAPYSLPVHVSPARFPTRRHPPSRWQWPSGRCHTPRCCRWSRCGNLRAKPTMPRHTIQASSKPSSANLSTHSFPYAKPKKLMLNSSSPSSRPPSN